MNFMNPKHWGGLLCALLTMGLASAQSVQYPFNPDHNGDNLIYTADILEVLAVYETEFDPEPITVDGLTLEEYLIQLNDAIDAVEAGTAGADGADGADGLDGQDGVGIASITDNGDGTLTIALTDGTVVMTSDFTGPAGADGADGADGAPGADGDDGADGVGISNVGLTVLGSLGVELTDGTLLDLGCVFDSDGDGICDQIDACSDEEAVNFEDPGNADCLYNAWYIPEILGTGPAVLATSKPVGYREADSECVQSVVDADAFCIESLWDAICQDAYEACLMDTETVLAGFDYDIGEIGPAGGVIVYVDTFDIHPTFDYLEAARADFEMEGWLGTLTEFDLECAPVVVLQPEPGEAEAQAVAEDEPGVFGGDYRVRHAGGTAVGTGRANTLELARYGDCPNFIATEVLRYQQNGYRDWFIPSVGELELMAAVLAGDTEILIAGGGGPGGAGLFPEAMSGNYWSSSEFDSNEQYKVGILNFIGTSIITFTDFFDENAAVRPVRAF